MSLGQIIGGVVGGAIGAFFGPVGFAIGVGIGTGIGGYIDPPKGPQQGVGKPQIQELNIATAKEGDVIPELLGISKIIGNIIHYWGSRTTEVKEQQETGKGGGSSTTVTTGYKYYLSWLQGICLGPVDYLYAVYKGENIVWAGELALPVSGGQQTITLTDYSDDSANGVVLGNLTFYFGTDDHALNSDFEAGLDDNTLNIPYRNLCYAYFDDVLLGQANRVPVFSFILAKRPVLSFNANNTINTYDYNAAHVIWWILEQMTDLPDSFLDVTSFSLVADTLNTENFGVSILFDSPGSANDYIDNLLLHIGGIKYYDTDGKLKLKLIRQDESESNMISISDDDLIEEPIIKRGSWMETVNEIHGIYPQRILTIPIVLETLYGTGANSQGQLGIGDTTNRNGFDLITNGTFTKVAAGLAHMATIKSDGTLWVSGSNLYGELGLGDNTQRDTLIQVGSDSNWSIISCSWYSTMAIKTDGTLWATGRNTNGQLGLGDSVNRNSFEQVGSLTNWNKVFGGSLRTYAINSSGELWGTGLNSSGQLGTGDLIDVDTLTQIGSASDWSTLSAGTFHNFALKTNGEMWVWGVAAQGQLGMGNVGVGPEGTEKSPVQFNSETDWTFVGTGDVVSYAIKSDGTMYGTGNNFEFELGLGHNNQVFVLIQIGSDTDWEKIYGNMHVALAIKTNGRVYGAGYVWPDLLGTGNVSDYEITFLAANDTDAFSIISANGQNHFIGIKQ